MNTHDRLRRLKQQLLWLPPLFLLLFLSACNSPNSSAPAFVDGHHGPEWVKEHGTVFINNSTQCHQCHGENLQDGGLLKTTGPTCFSASSGATICHGPLSGPWHNRNNNPIFYSKHGELAQRQPILSEEGPQGFNLCVACHGANTTGANFPGQRLGEETLAASCVGCHATVFSFTSSAAPHPDADAWDSKHSLTSPENAQSCAVCHRNRGDFRAEIWGGISFQYDANAAPGCLNNTLCHGENVNPHVGQPNWSTPVLHGVQAKQSPQRGNLYGFSNCARCHGPQLTVNCANNCHVPPHPASWTAVAAGIVTHVSTNEDNVATCVQCHAGGALSPLATPVPPPAGTPLGCYNNTLCHGSMTPHDNSWSDPNNHGVSAKLPPPPVGAYDIDQFVNCQNCHGIYFDANKCGSCHLPPHPADWSGLGFGPYSHTGTDTTNASVCFNCHAAGSANNSVNPAYPPLIGTEPGCFNNTMCHGDENQYSPANHKPQEVWSLPGNSHGASAKAAPSSTDSAQGFLRCVVCHNLSYTCSTGGNPEPCHTPPHPDAWSGIDTKLTHRDTQGANAVVCAKCHPLRISLPPGSDSSCFNISGCH